MINHAYAYRSLAKHCSLFSRTSSQPGPEQELEWWSWTRRNIKANHWRRVTQKNWSKYVMCFNHSTFDVWRQTYTTRHDCSSRMISWWRFPAWKDYYLVSSCRGTAEDRYAIKSGSSALCNKKRQSGSADFQGDGRSAQTEWFIWRVNWFKE